MSQQRIQNTLIYDKFIVQLMKKGKKSKAEKIFEKVLIILASRGYSPLKTIMLAINNVKPLIEIRNVKRRGNAYSIPFPLNLSRQLTFSIRLLIKNGGKGSSISKSLVEEIIASSLGTSESVKQTQAVHKTGRQNRFFTHYRWF